MAARVYQKRARATSYANSMLERFSVNRLIETQACGGGAAEGAEVSDAAAV